MLKKLLLLVLIACTLFACEQEPTSNEILFVCTHGAARSPIASAYFNKLAKENSLSYHAVFRGTEPNEKLSKETISGLKNDGFTVSDWKPRKVSDKDAEKAYKIVTFDCAVPSKNTATLKEEWNNTPSISKDYNAARDIIKAHVEELIESLKEE